MTAEEIVMAELRHRHEADPTQPIPKCIGITRARDDEGRPLASEEDVAASVLEAIDRIAAGDYEEIEMGLPRTRKPQRSIKEWLHSHLRRKKDSKRRWLARARLGKPIPKFAFEDVAGLSGRLHVVALRDHAKAFYCIVKRGET